MTWSGTEKVLKPMLEALVAQFVFKNSLHSCHLSESHHSIDDENRLAYLELIISFPDISRDLICKLAKLLFQAVLSEDGDDNSESRTKSIQLLSNLYQRKQADVQVCVDEILSEQELDREGVEKLLTSLALVRTMPSDATSQCSHTV